MLLTSAPVSSARLTEQTPLDPRAQFAKSAAVQSSNGQGPGSLGWILGITAALLLVSLGVLLELEPRTLYRKFTAH